MSDLLSVVIPIGGVDEWLDIAVESALNQTGLSDLDAEIEVIAVFNNGAEPPAGWRFSADPRVRVLHDPLPLGPGGAGQAGIDASRGNYLVCLDADDRMLPERMQLQLKWLRGHPEATLVSSQVDWIDGAGKVIGAFSLPTADDVRAELIALNVCPHSAWMARMDAVRRVGGYNLSMNQMEDYDLLLRIGELGPIAVLPQTLTEYRLHPEQMSRAVRPNGHYVRTIAKHRRALGSTIGMPRSRVALAGLWWELQQWFMFFGRKVRGARS